MAALDLVTFGDVIVDQYYALDAVPVAGKQRAEYLGSWAGGMAGNVAAIAAEQGLRCAVVASVGADAWGARLMAELAARGVDLRWLAVRGSASGRTVVGALPGGERVLLVAAGPHAAPPLDALDEVLAARPRAIYTAALDLGAALRIAAAAAAAGVPVMADVEDHEAERDPDAAARLADACALVACSEATAERLGPRRAGAVRLLLRGAAGLTIEADAGAWSGSPPAEPPVLDTTGGGDAAVAGACAGVLAGDDPAAIGARALRAAAAVVGRRGVRDRLDEGGEP